MPLRSPSLIVSFLVCLAAIPAAEAAESVYTDLKLDQCKALLEPNPDEPGGDSMSSLCAGHGKYQVLFKEGDLRQSIHYGFLKQTIVDNAFESFGQFNYMNPKIEWRVDASGKPYAAIQRFFMGDTKENTGQVLTISRVGQPGEEEGCPVGYVDALANPDPNALARQVADTIAATFACGKQAPQYYGVRGTKAGDPMIYHGDPEPAAE